MLFRVLKAEIYNQNMALLHRQPNNATEIYTGSGVTWLIGRPCANIVVLCLLKAVLTPCLLWFVALHWWQRWKTSNLTATWDQWSYIDGLCDRISTSCVVPCGNFDCVFARVVSSICNGGKLNHGFRGQRYELFNEDCWQTGASVWCWKTAWVTSSASA